ncbi:unnamed protein product, partial [Didymodactylos carnosus]
GHCTIQVLGKQVFRIDKIGETNVIYGIKVNQPVVTYEQLFRKVKECHERVGHSGTIKLGLK